MRRVYSNLGICYTNKGAFEKAEKYFLKTFDIGKKVYGEEHHWTCNFYWNLGRFYQDAGQFQKALDAYQKEFKVRTILQYNKVDLAENHSRLGMAYYQLQRYEESFKEQNQAMAMVCNDFTPGDKYAVPTVEQVIDKTLALRYCANKLGTIHEYLRQQPEDSRAIETSIALGDLSLALWQNLRYELGQQEQSKQQQGKQTRKAVQYASLLAHHSHPEKSWELAEQGKSLLLLEAYLQADASSHLRLAPDLAAQEQELSQQLADYESQLLSAEEAQDQAKIDHIRNQLIFDARRNYEQLIKEIEQSNPSYYDW